MSSAVQGSFVDYDLSAPTADKIAWQVWNESSRNAANTAEEGWTPDVGATGGLTLLHGTYRAKTDQCVDGLTYAAGDKLTITASGLLTNASVAAGDVVIGYALGAAVDGVSFKGNSYDNVLEYITV
jgi:hypothetical protein